MNTLTLQRELAPELDKGLKKREIHAPKNFVSVYHETTDDALDSIAAHGLLVDHDDKNIGDHMFVRRVNWTIDKDRPEKFWNLGLERSTAIFAYPDLAQGHGLGGAANRFKKVDAERLRDGYDSVVKYLGKTAFQDIGVESFEDYLFFNTDPDLLREQHPGEVLEMKVDPSLCYVGELSRYSDLAMRIKEGAFHAGDAEDYYWSHLVRLDSFLEQYKWTEWDEEGNGILSPELFKDGQYASGEKYRLLADAPDGLTLEFVQPEILIPTTIPPEHIRLVGDDEVGK